LGKRGLMVLAVSYECAVRDRVMDYLYGKTTSPPVPLNAHSLPVTPLSGQNVYQGLIETIRRVDGIGDNRGLNHVI
jgi:hypothetical protein